MDGQGQQVHVFWIPPIFCILQPAAPLPGFTGAILYQGNVE